MTQIKLYKFIINTDWGDHEMKCDPWNEISWSLLWYKIYIKMKDTVDHYLLDY